uniref:Cytochrome b5 heme-binding domain-containing protein n=1 Tax=Populus alba TaxID=43335 RepID=A0A4U5R256_POPAL|nr:hypothetical protein D5086_0000010450 [Populus alba]
MSLKVELMTASIAMILEDKNLAWRGYCYVPRRKAVYGKLLRGCRIRKDATNDFENVGHIDDAREMMEKNVIDEVDVTTVPTKPIYVAPGLGGTNPKDEKPGFLIKILQLLVPLLILGLALAVRTYTKKE